MFRLTLVQGAEHADQPRLELSLGAAPARVLIGRDPAAHWPIADRTRALSARHCELRVEADRVMLHDQSTNGTFVNGATQRLGGPHRLRDGDRIQLGPYVMAVQALQTPAGTPPAAADTPDDPPADSLLGVLRDDTTPLRGGDPAAMLAAGWRVDAGPGLGGAPTAGRAAPRPVATAAGVEAEVTRIERAPPQPGPRSRVPRPGIAADPTPRPRPPGLAPAQQQALAEALGLPAAALPALDAQDWLLRLATLCRRGVQRLHAEGRLPAPGPDAAASLTALLLAADPSALLPVTDRPEPPDA
ncbi:MAG: hypothetical protein RLY78_1038 [Pseudomonadota bacterium]|jgi:predicted component of type VI protein secretion system